MARVRKIKKKKLRDQVQDHATKGEDDEYDPVPEYKGDLFFPTGSTLLNLCCSDKINGGIAATRITTIPGSSSAGKTMLAMSILAEASIREKFDDYELIYDDAEESLSFDIELLFGKKLARRMKRPLEGDIHSNTIQDFKHAILYRCSLGIPFIYILDSLDSLSSDEELEREYKEALKATKNPEQLRDIKGSYHAEKAKIIGHVFRMINGELKKTSSGLVVVQQTRQKFNATQFEEKEVTSGGNAPFFYSTHQIWLKLRGMEKNKIWNKKIGNKISVRVKKNKVTGKERDCQFSIYTSLGIDDLGSCIDFLKESKTWSMNGSYVNAKDLGLKLQYTDLINKIEKNNLEKDVRKIVGKAWRRIEAEVQLDRKPRYG